MKALFACCVIALCVAVASAGEITTVEGLYKAIVDGPLRKVAFLSLANYESVKLVLPAMYNSKDGTGYTQVVICNGKPNEFDVVCSSTNDIIDHLQNGKLLAALISGLPDDDQQDRVHAVSSKFVSARSMLMAPELSADSPRGLSGDNSSYHLSLALDSAIGSVQSKRLDVTAAEGNKPFNLISVHTCKPAAFDVPNTKDATGQLKKVLASKVLKIGALGRFNWDQDGDYTQEPPVGFYPELMTHICNEFNALKGPDGVQYGPGIKCERVYHNTSEEVFQDLLSGKTQATEPYYVIDAAYAGTKESCKSDADCGAAPLSGGHEICMTGQCTYTPQQPRKNFFRLSCVTLGQAGTFLTARKPSDSGMVFWLIIVIVVGSIALIVFLAAIVYLVHKEKKGDPVFRPLSGPDGTDTRATDDMPLNSRH